MSKVPKKDGVATQLTVGSEEASSPEAILVNPEGQINDQAPGEKSWSIRGIAESCFNRTYSDIKDAPQKLYHYFMDAPENDYRSIPGKIRDAVLAPILSAPVWFNLANIPFNHALDNSAAANGFIGVAIFTGLTTVIDSWKNRAPSSSYIFNAGVQGAGGLSYVPMLVHDPINAVKGMVLYGTATVAHTLRAREEKKAHSEGIPIDRYQQNFGSAATYSGTYYSASEVIAINTHEPDALLESFMDIVQGNPQAATDPNSVVAVLAGLSLARALNDKKLWDLHPSKGDNLVDIFKSEDYERRIDKIKDGAKWLAASATAPRLAAAAYGGAAAISGDLNFMQAYLAWGIGNANLDLIRPKVEMMIKKIYANDPEQVRAAMTSFENLNKLEIMRTTLKIQEKTEPLLALIDKAVDNHNWDEVSMEAIRLFEDAEENSVEQMLYLSILKDISPASRLARQKLNTLDYEWDDTRPDDLLGEYEASHLEGSPAI